MSEDTTKYRSFNSGISVKDNENGDLFLDLPNGTVIRISPRNGEVYVSAAIGILIPAEINNVPAFKVRRN